MPPRKKAKPTAATTPLAESPNIEDLRLNDPWTTEQETQLFKSMMRWKPTGISHPE